MLNFFDAHCHIEPGAADASARAIASPERGRLLCGVGPEDWRGVTLLASRWEHTLPAFGLHPWYAAGQDESWTAGLEKLLALHPTAWVGEIGLDFLKTDRVPEEAQTSAFAAQLQLAKRCRRRINLHCVKAYEQLLRLLDEHYLEARENAFIIHSFNGPHQFVKRLLDRGAYFSIGPLASRRDSPRTRARVALIPPERLLLESDAFLVPGEDAVEELEAVLGWLGGVHGEKPAFLNERILDNARRLYEGRRD